LEATEENKSEMRYIRSDRLEFHPVLSQVPPGLTGRLKFFSEECPHGRGMPPGVFRGIKSFPERSHAGSGWLERLTERVRRCPLGFDRKAFLKPVPAVAGFCRCWAWQVRREGA
jgi:hypothetical protein